MQAIAVMFSTSSCLEGTIGFGSLQKDSNGKFLIEATIDRHNS